MKSNSAARRSLRAITLLVLAVIGLFGFRWGAGNFGEVVPGRVYRSAQLSGAGLERVIEARHIRTVVNLRGPNPDSAWYREERKATSENGVTQVDLTLASDHWLSRDQVGALVETIEESEYPILIHCQWGAERSGLVSAMVELLQPGSTLADARAQFSIWHLYLPTEEGLIMKAHIEQYDSWLRDKHLTHSPEQFRRWLLNSYRPGRPSREDWPYDPYPLKVVHRPRPAAENDDESREMLGDRRADSGSSRSVSRSGGTAVR